MLRKFRFAFFLEIVIKRINIRFLILKTNKKVFKPEFPNYSNSEITLINDATILSYKDGITYPLINVPCP